MKRDNFIILLLFVAGLSISLLTCWLASPLWSLADYQRFDETKQRYELYTQPSYEFPREITAENVTFCNDYTPFRYRSEAGQWVIDTGITKKTYIPVVYDCEDFAIDLWKMAQEDDRLIGLLVLAETDRHGNRSLHMANFTIVGNEIVRIEPETGRIYKLGVLDIGEASIDPFGR